MTDLIASERAKRVDALLEWADDAHRGEMPWCPDHQKGKCKSCAEKVAAWRIARMYIESLR